MIRASSWEVGEGFSQYLLVMEMTIKIERKPAYLLANYLECHQMVISEFKDGDVHFLLLSLGSPKNFFFLYILAVR